MWHDGLKKHRLITGADQLVVTRKAALQQDEWEARWDAAQRKAQAQRSKDHARRQKEEEKQYREDQKQAAAARTAEAQEELDRAERLLSETLTIDDAVDWEALKNRSPFPEPAPPMPTPPAKPSMESRPPEPREASYAPVLSILDNLIRSRREAKETDARLRFQQAHAAWIRACEDAAQRDTENLRVHAERTRKLEFDHRAALEAWSRRRTAFEAEQASNNTAVDAQKQRYLCKDPEAIEQYADLVLSRSAYPEWCPQEFEIQYLAEPKILVVTYSLPAFSDLPRLKEVRYVQSKDEFGEKEMSEGEAQRLYDSVVYQIALRTIHELFEADAVSALDSIVYNGWVRSIDPRTGTEVDACIMSVQATRAEFLQINLSQVDPKACFKALKGVGSSKLHSLTPVAPIVQIRRDDGRFIPGREVANTLDDSMNLAVMDWEDFEHLIREVFEKEFAAGGAEVRVTQASRDGGVDAVIFDPDPIRGGKIIVQAKRYTNTVGVAAVRDLYGTVMNEGANKGILVTTSDYGPDAYTFANGKPITLLSGANLLHMLERHGHKARIDIREARKLMGET
jgi:restriction system protein